MPLPRHPLQLNLGELDLPLLTSQPKYLGFYISLHFHARLRDSLIHAPWPSIFILHAVSLEHVQKECIVLPFFLSSLVPWRANLSHERNFISTRLDSNLKFISTKVNIAIWNVGIPCEVTEREGMCWRLSSKRNLSSLLPAISTLKVGLQKS